MTISSSISLAVSFESQALFQECHHIKPSLSHAAIYCFLVASAFVLSLYILVPAHVRRLDRDDSVQIKWRTFATGNVCLFAILLYPYCFCGNSDITRTDGNGQSVMAVIGLVPNLPLWNYFGPLAHSIMLYMGPIFVMFLQAKLMAEAIAKPEKPTMRNYLEAWNAVFFPTSLMPMQSTNQRWISLRSKVIAPILEEVVFRGCMVPPLMATGKFHPWAVAWVSPIFFGLAHLHHAILKLRQGEPWKRVAMATAFQFLYTTMFGAYVAYAFLRCQSIVAVILSHSFCNTMGLPSLSFLNQHSPLYHKKIALMKAHLLGVAIFIWGFTSSAFLPVSHHKNK